MNNEFEFETLFADDPETLALFRKTAVMAPASPPTGGLSDVSVADHLSPEELFAKAAGTVPLPPLQPLRHRGKAQNPPRTKRRKIAPFIFNFLFYLLCIAIVGGSAMFALSGDTTKSYFGYRIYTVKTPSMTPQEGGPSGGFYAGDLILVKLVHDPAEIQVGDIVTYIPGKDPQVYLTHRVVEILDHLNEDSGLFFVTQGDANDTPDPPILDTAVVGKTVGSVRWLGWALTFVRQNFVLTIVLLVSTFGFIIMIRSCFSNPKKKEAGQRNAPSRRNITGLPEKSVYI